MKKKPKYSPEVIERTVYMVNEARSLLYDAPSDTSTTRRKKAYSFAIESCSARRNRNPLTSKRIGILV